MQFATIETTEQELKSIKAAISELITLKGMFQTRESTLRLNPQVWDKIKPKIEKLATTETELGKRMIIARNMISGLAVDRSLEMWGNDEIRFKMDEVQECIDFLRTVYTADVTRNDWSLYEREAHGKGIGY